MAYTDELRTELQAAKYAPLTAQSDTTLRNVQLAALVNAPTVTEEENPDPQGTIQTVPKTIEEILAVVNDAEWAAIMGDEFSPMIAKATAAKDDALAVLTYMRAEGVKMDGTIGSVGNQILTEADAGVVGSLLAVLLAAGTISKETGAKLTALMTQPDPSWSPVIYTYGQSVAQAHSWPVVQPADVAEALS